VREDFAAGRFGLRRIGPPGGCRPIVLVSLLILGSSVPLEGQETIASDRPGIGSGSFLPSLALPTSKPVGVFLGYAGFFAESQNQHFLEGGLTWVPTPDLQLDANGGVDPDSGGYFVGIGLATRWFLRG